MLLEQWVKLLFASCIALVFWLAGFGAGNDDEQSWIGWVFGAIIVVALLLSSIAIIGPALIK